MDPGPLATLLLPLPLPRTLLAMSRPLASGIQRHHGLRAWSEISEFHMWLIFEVSYSVFSYLKQGLAVVNMLTKCLDAHVEEGLIWSQEKTHVPRSVEPRVAAAT